MARRIVSAREQQACRIHLADSAGAASGSGDTCDPMVQNCGTGSDKNDTAGSTPGGSAPREVKPSAGSNSEGFYNQRRAPGSGGGGISNGVYTTPSGGGGVPARSYGGHPDGGPPSQSLTQALSRAGIDPSMYPLISGFSVAEGNNPSGAPTLGFTDTQAGSSLDEHAQALAQQIQDRQSVAGPFPHGGSPAEQASWMATTVGQNGSPSDWQGNAQPARSDYVDRIVQNMPVAPAPGPQTPAVR